MLLSLPLSIFTLFIYILLSQMLLQNLEPVCEGEPVFLLLAYVLQQGGVEPLALADLSISILFRLQIQSGNFKVVV
jgi:hypothetical protein